MNNHPNSRPPRPTRPSNNRGSQHQRYPINGVRPYFGLPNQQLNPVNGMRANFTIPYNQRATLSQQVTLNGVRPTMFPRGYRPGYQPPGYRLHVTHPLMVGPQGPPNGLHSRYVPQPIRGHVPLFTRQVPNVQNPARRAITFMSGPSDMQARGLQNALPPPINNTSVLDRAVGNPVRRTIDQNLPGSSRINRRMGANAVHDPQPPTLNIAIPDGLEQIVPSMDQNIMIPEHVSGSEDSDILDQNVPNPQSIRMLTGTVMQVCNWLSGPRTMVYYDVTAYVVALSCMRISSDPIRGTEHLIVLRDHMESGPTLQVTYYPYVPPDVPPLEHGQLVRVVGKPCGDGLLAKQRVFKLRAIKITRTTSDAADAFKRVSYVCSHANLNN